MTGYTSKTATKTTASLEPNDVISLAVDCPTGTSAIGGGARVTGSSNTLLYENTPQADLGGWQASARNADENAFDSDVQLTVTVICADID